MAELTPRERLQPCLIDRLTDDEPDKQVESREMRVVSLTRYRQAVTRDIAWLLNTPMHRAADELYEFDHVAHSVLNYGIPDVCGITSHSTSVEEMEQKILAALKVFEPRLLKHSLSVTGVADQERADPNAVTFEIAGELWAQPSNAALYIKTAFDLETGHSDLFRGES